MFILLLSILLIYLFCVLFIMVSTLGDDYLSDKNKIILILCGFIPVYNFVFIILMIISELKNKQR